MASSRTVNLDESNKLSLLPTKFERIFSRCSRSDCSTSSLLDSSSSSTNHIVERKGFVASDSILAPVFRSGIQDKLTPLNQISGMSSSATSDRCDAMVDLKFQWLVKLCWILISLVALMFCISFYLCIASDSSGRSSSKKSRSHGVKHLRSEKHQGAARKSTPPSTTQSQSSDQSAATTTYLPKSQMSAADATESLDNTTDGGWNSSSMALTEQQQQQQQEMDQLRENNHFLANKQHMLLNDFLAAKNAIEEYEQQQQSRSILGRSEDTFGRRHQLGSQILRRRSIGGSAALLSQACMQDTETLPATTTAGHHQRSDQVGGRLDPKHKLKSKSQTTIYYEQGQDPFKAIPFGAYLGAGYLSSDDQQKHYHTDATPETVPRQPRSTYTFMGDQHSADPTNFTSHNNHQANTHWSTNFEPQSLPMLNNNQQQFQDTFVLDNPRLTNHQPQLWTGGDDTPMPVASQQPESRQSHQLSTSQFDPQSHSRQLIDLIQQKHREQMSQANRTAASMKPHHTLMNNNSGSQPAAAKPMPRPILASQRQTNRTDQRWQ